MSDFRTNRSPFRSNGVGIYANYSSHGSTFRQDVEKGPITPTLPQARRDAPLPGLRSRVAQSLNVPPTGKEPVSAGSGWAGGMLRLGPSFVAALLDSLFEHRAVMLVRW